MVVVVERQYKHDFEYSVVVILIGGGVGWESHWLTANFVTWNCNTQALVVTDCGSRFNRNVDI